jgi:hypothetical protein
VTFYSSVTFLSPNSNLNPRIRPYPITYADPIPAGQSNIANVRTEPSLSSSQSKGISHGFGSNQDPRILIGYVEGGKRTGRPKEMSEASVEQAVLPSVLVTKDRAGGEKSCETLTDKGGIGRFSVNRILYKYELRNTNPRYRTLAYQLYQGSVTRFFCSR